MIQDRPAWREGEMGGFYIGRERKARTAYGFDEVALVPGREEFRQGTRILPGS